MAVSGTSKAFAPGTLIDPIHAPAAFFVRSTLMGIPAAA